MMSAAALTVSIIHKVAALRATIQGRATYRWTQLSDRFCNRLLIKGVRVRSLLGSILERICTATRMTRLQISSTPADKQRAAASCRIGSGTTSIGTTFLQFAVQTHSTSTGADSEARTSTAERIDSTTFTTKTRVTRDGTLQGWKPTRYLNLAWKRRVVWV